MDKEYFGHLKRMRKMYERWDGTLCSPYHFDEGAYCPQTPIERNMWSDFRNYGIPMFYQFPIGKYYADFCDPFHGLVVETDGKIHLTKIDKDKERDKYMQGVGFSILRIKGRETYDHEEWDENDTYHDYEKIKISEGIQKVFEWYETRGIGIPPMMSARVNGVESELFKRWKKSIGV